MGHGPNQHVLRMFEGEMTAMRAHQLPPLLFEQSDQRGRVQFRALGDPCV